ncbi:hypothetical protein EDD85DRAFT_958884 [Armillaria nabsnona]|nr:hypothetical protein EDD85DRAFT_958884 [Armillaria nabsnona]
MASPQAVSSNVQLKQSSWASLAGDTTNHPDFYTFVKEKRVEAAIPPLQVVKAAAGLIPVPALGLATDIILSILESASQQNSGTCREIAYRCLRAQVTLSEHLQGVEITPRLLDSIRRFEADLHDVQETVERYKHRKRIDRFFHSKSYNDDLQRLGKRIDATLSFFQINRLLSLDEICVKIYASVQRLEAAPRPEGASVDVIYKPSSQKLEEIINGPGYSLQKAEMRSGNIVTIRVFTGRKAKSTWEASNKFDLNVMYANLPHLIGTSSSDERGALYSAYDLDIKDRVEGVILAKMSQDVDEIVYMCARILTRQIHGISSALNTLSKQARLFDMGAEDLDILWDARGRVVLAIHPEAASSSTALVSPGDHTLRLLGVMDDICGNEYGSFLRLRQPVHRLHAIDDPTVLNHLGTGYRREELTPTDAILDNKVVVYYTPPNRVFVWGKMGDVIRGVLRSTSRGVGGALMFSVMTENLMPSGRNIVMPAAGVTISRGDICWKY